MTPFLFEVATIPFALYFLALAWLHCRNHPTLITSRRDFGRVPTLESIGRDITPSGWKRLRNALDKELEQAPRPPRRAWPAFLTAGLALLAADVFCFVYYYSQICEALAFYMSA